MYGSLPRPLVSKSGFQGCFGSFETNGELVDPVKNALVPSELVEEGCEGEMMKKKKFPKQGLRERGKKVSFISTCFLFATTFFCYSLSCLSSSFPRILIWLRCLLTQPPPPFPRSMLHEHYRWWSLARSQSKDAHLLPLLRSFGSASIFYHFSTLRNEDPGRTWTCAPVLNSPK